MDRLIFVGLYRLAPSTVNTQTIVKPETVVRWHRAGFRSYWRSKSRQVRKKLITNLHPWIASASMSLIASFASGIIQDTPAVRAALTEPWSNGQTDGQITKLELVKRQMSRNTHARAATALVSSVSIHYC